MLKNKQKEKNSDKTKKKKTKKSWTAEILNKEPSNDEELQTAGEFLIF